jgi:hypothetical protein
MSPAAHRAGLLAALVAVAAGCSSDKSFALVSVLSTAGQFNDVSQLLVDVENGSYQDFLTYPKVPMATYRFDNIAPLTFSVSFRSSHSGPLTVKVTTLDATGANTGYGTGTADIDRDNVTKVTVLVTRGAPTPPRVDAGADGPRDAGKQDLGPPCDPTAAATACGSGKTCIVGCRRDGTTAGMCVLAGNKPPGAACNDDCEQGSECFTFSCESGPQVRSCLRLCSQDSQCGQGRCSTSVPCLDKPTPFKVCSQPCDPVGGTSGCAPGLGCYLFEGEIPDCDCPSSKRTGSDGVACMDSTTCQTGLFCVSTGGTKTCRPLCRLAAPQCEAGRTCVKLVTPDYSTFGACLP